MDLNKFSRIRRLIVWVKMQIYRRFWGMDIHPTVEFSLSARFDKTYPRGVHIGQKTYVAFDAAILTHDRTRRLYLHTRIGQYCFIGARSIIMPGVSIGNECIVGSGAVVTHDVPDRSMVAGNPARVINSGEILEEYGTVRSAEQPRADLRQ